VQDCKRKDAKCVARRRVNANCGEIMPTSELVNVIRMVIEEVWNQGALDRADIFFAPDYINHGGLIPDVVRGPEAIKFSVALYRLAFPALQIAIEDLAVDGEIATLRWTARGEPAGAGHALSGVTYSRFAGRRIAESWTYWDAKGDASLLGVVPHRAEPYGRARGANGAGGFVA
jgi:predicted SnoaL-like aldol condensation-catalyzing enzyme